MTTYTKLRDGSWGLRSHDTLTAGATVTVTKRDGSTKTEQVGQILWTGNEITLATVVRHTPTRLRRSRYVSNVIQTSGGTFYQNKRGRCEDAPCCGCCTV